MSYFIKNGNRFSVTSQNALDIHERLPKGVYSVNYDKTFDEFYLLMAEDFTNPKKLYGDVEKRADRIINTYRDRTSNTGVLLCGEKGSGKTQLAKSVSIFANKLDIPTIIVSSGYTGDKFNKFIQDITQECVIIFDEFEKVYNKESQEQVLTLLDGVYVSKKLFILTCNDKYRIDTNMKNRPSRIYYYFDYVGLDKAFIEEYCDDNLNNKDHIVKVVSLSNIFGSFNFDILKSMVEEMNRYGEDPVTVLEYLNARPTDSSPSTFKIDVFIDDKLFDTQTQTTNPLEGNGFYYDTRLSDAQHEYLKGIDLEGCELDGMVNTKDLVSINKETGNMKFEKQIDGFKVEFVFEKQPFKAFDLRAF